MCFLYNSVWVSVCVQLCSAGEKGGEREQRGSIVGLCVAQIVLFSGKVETQHSSPEVWLPGERGGKKREKNRAGERVRESCIGVERETEKGEAREKRP